MHRALGSYGRVNRKIACPRCNNIREWHGRRVKNPPEFFLAVCPSEGRAMPEDRPEKPPAVKQPAADLLPDVYAELRRLAAALSVHLRPGQTLQPTALVHEAYLRLVRDEDP